jgi:cyanate permease
LTGTFAPLGASLLYDRFGSYQLVLWIVVALAVAATGVVFWARRNMKRSPVNIVLDEQVAVQSGLE